MKKLLSIVLTLIVLTLAFTACGAKAVTSITIDGGLIREYSINATPDFSNVTATVKYNDESTKTVTADELTFGELDTSTAGTKQLTISYGDFSISVDVVVKAATTITKKIVNIVVTEGIDPTYEIDTTPDFTGVKATVIYNDGTTKDVTAEDLTIGTVDTATSGEKLLSVTYEDFTTTVKITVIDFITGITVNEGIEEEYEIGSTPDFTGIKATVTYSDGTTKDVTYADLTVGTIDTSAPGSQNLAISYEGFVIYVVITIPEPAPTYDITGALLPSAITNRNEYKKSFKDLTQVYVIGDDNAFTLALIINAFDQNDDMVSGIEYIGASIVYLVGDDGEQIVGTDYVTVDEFKHTFDFTEAAIGKTFRIVTRPSEITDEDMLEDVTNELVVKIVDGYNITNAKELNIITNTNDDINEDGVGEQLEVVNTFLQNNLITRPENLKGVVLHNNLLITAKDLPQEYFITYTKDGETKTELYDWLSVYHRTLTAANPTFNIYGNYYTLYSYELPCVVAYGFGNQEDDYSNSELFKFEVETSLFVDGADFSGFGANLYDVGLVDSHPNSNDDAVSDRSMRGLIGIKVESTTLNVTNTKIEKFFNSVNVAYDYSTLNLDKVIFYNAWHGHLFIWADNSHQEDGDEPWASHKPIHVNIKDSDLTKCGGPVILAQNNNPDKPRNKNSNITTNIDENSHLESWVTGEEAWFKAVGASQIAGQIKVLSNLLTLSGANFGKTASYVSFQWSNLILFLPPNNIYQPLQTF